MRTILVLFFLSLTSTAYGITLVEGIEKCRAMTKEERVDSALCQKVIAKIKEYKAAGKPIPGYPPVKTNQTQAVSASPVTPNESVKVTTVNSTKKDTSEQDYAKLEKIKEKCQKLNPPNQYKYKICHQFMSMSNDPYFGKDKPTLPQYSFSLGYSLLGDVNGLEIEIERRTSNFGIGLFYTQQIISDSNDNISGAAYGASARYHFTPLYYTKKNNIDVAGFGQVGITSYSSPVQGNLPNYIYFNVGVDISMPVVNFGSTTIRGFAKAGMVHIYHSESSFLSLGGSGTIGLKFDF